MNRFISPLSLAAVLCFCATGAFAFGHKQVPDDLGFYDMLRWHLSFEVEHFAAHLSMTYRALVALAYSWQEGLLQFDAMRICAADSFTTSVLFSSAFTSVFTLHFTVFVGGLLMLLTLRHLAWLFVGTLPKSALRIG